MLRENLCIFIGAMLICTTLVITEEVSEDDHGSQATLSSSSSIGWPMFHRTMDHKGYTPENGPNVATLLWSKYLQANVNTAPAVVNEQVYTYSFASSQRRFLYLNAETGSTLWQFNVPSGSVCSAPAVVNNKVYIGTNWGVGDFFCLDANTGSIIWQKNIGSVYTQGAVVVDDIVYISTNYDGIYALNALDGSEIWSVSGGSLHAGVAIDGDLIYGIVRWSVRAFNRFNGTEIWSYGCSRGIGSSPTVAYGNVYFQVDNGYIYSLDKTSGSLVWSYNLGASNWNAIKSSPAAGFGKIFVGVQKGGKDFYCLDAYTGSYIWSYELSGSVISSPVISGNRIVYIATNTLYAFDVDGGSLIWSYGLTGSEARASPAIYNEVIYIPTSSVMYAIGEYDEPPSDNMPPIADAGDLYIGEEGKKITFDASGSSDPDGDALTYRWDFNGDSTWDTGWLTSPYTDYTWGDDYSGQIILEVSDGELSDSDFALISISNVAPIGGINGIYSGDEGSLIVFSAEAQDAGSDDLKFLWEIEFGPTIAHTHYNNGISPDPDPSPQGIYPFYAVDNIEHIFGDNAIFNVSLTISDDDGESVIYTTTATIDNTPPVIEPFEQKVVDEGSPFIINATAMDNGSDDLIFTWEFELGPTVTNVHYNDGVGSDPYPSPGGFFPYSAHDTVGQTYGDNGYYKIILSVSDDDGGVSTYSTGITVRNVAPFIEPITPQNINEGTPFTLFGRASDFGSDDLKFSWYLELGPDFVKTYFNNGLTSDPSLSPWEIFPIDVMDTISHSYGDDGNYSVVLIVEDDDGGVTEIRTYVLVENVAPKIEDFSAYLLVNLTLRAAGEKWHNVEMIVIEDGSQIGYAEVVRSPGSPDAQSVTLNGLKCDVTKDIQVEVLYTPMDDPINGQRNGATPVWIIMEFIEGEDIRLHHTCNVQNPDTWEWIVDVNPQFVGYEITLDVSAWDPGSDDLSFSWNFGGNITHFNDGIMADPYPSPDGIFPFYVFHSQTYIHNGSETIYLTIYDDDGGMAFLSIYLI